MPTSNARKGSTSNNSKSIEKPIDGVWITSGKLGSCDAVLVFRTNVLNPRVVSSAGKDSQCDTEENDSTATRYDNPNSCSSVFDENTSSPASLPSTSRSACITPPLLNESNEYSKSNKITSLNSKTDDISDQRKTKANKICNSDQETKVNSLGNSLSSSENSITSDCDESNQPCDVNVSNTGEEGELDSCSGCAEEDNENSSEDFENGPFDNDMPAIQLKITYKFMQTETKLLRKIFVRHGLTEVEGEQNFSILWAGVHMKPDILRNLSPYQRVNHFPRSYELTRKDRLYKNIEKMQHLRGIKHFDIVPQSYLLPMEYRDLVTAHNKGRGPWIVKPAASSRGRGIFIVNSPDQIPQDEQVLVSKYIANPLCIDGHKCDLRVYVLVTSFDPLLIYIYEEGLVRLATVKYDRKADNLWNPCMHLCNYSINKYHSDYIKSNDAHEEDVGHKWTLSALLRHLRSQGCDTRQLMANIEDIIIKSIFACTQTIVTACRMFVPNGNNCFELYGFDILIDDALKPWLLEINLSPSMGVDTPLDARVKACLIVDLLTCIGIPAYSASMRAHYDSKWTRFRNITCSRRTNSAEPAGGSNSYLKKGNQREQVSLPLTLDEQRVIRNARLQNARRGGFVRIFPTEDSMTRYGMFLDSTTGIPMSTTTAQGTVAFSMILPHNYNAMLFSHLYGKDSQNNGIFEDNSFDKRMLQYERALEAPSLVHFDKKPIGPKCMEEGKRLRKQILKLIDNGSEMTRLQARQCFAMYLEAVLYRITQEPRDFHEKIILKFLNRIGGTIKAPVFFRNPHNLRLINKAHSAMVAKLLGDFLEQYTRDTEVYVDSFDHYGMIPNGLFNEFLSQAHEVDLEAVLTFHTNVTNSMPYLYNRFGLSVPPTPPIPSGVHGFLRALPAMVINGSAGRDFNKNEGYYRSMEKEITESNVKSKLNARNK